MIPETINQIIRNVSEYLNSIMSPTGNLIQTVLVIVVLLLLRYVFLFVVFRGNKDPSKYYNYKRYTAQIIFVIGIFLVGRIWFEGFQSLATFLGLLSVGLALALRELLTDLAGWIFIMVRKPFDIGDRIEVIGVKGDVIDKRLFTFSVIEIGNRVDAEQSTGRVIHIPNSKVFTEYVANYTSGFKYLWHEVPVFLTFESDYEKAQEILMDITNNHTLGFVEEAEKNLVTARESLMLKFSILTPTVYTKVRENGIVITARFLCDARRTRGIEQLIWMDVLKSFRKHPEIRFAYQTIRVVSQHDQGSSPQV